MGKLRREVTQASLSDVPELTGPVLSSTPGRVGSSHEMPPAAVRPPCDRVGRAGDPGCCFAPVTSGWLHLLRTFVSERLALCRD